MPMSLGMEDYHRPVVEERAIDPFVARAALERLADRAREGLAWATAAAILGVALIALGEPRYGFPPLMGTVVGLAVASVARADRRALVARLVRQRSAYEIDEVARAADRIVTADACALAARAVGRLVLEAEGLRPSNPRFARRHERVRACRQELVAIAFHLGRGDARVHPTALLLLQRILTATQTSPLYRADATAVSLRAALRRVEAGIEAGPRADDADDVEDADEYWAEAA
jgi:hypothetical protein